MESALHSKVRKRCCRGHESACILVGLRSVMGEGSSAFWAIEVESDREQGVVFVDEVLLCICCAVLGLSMRTGCMTLQCSRAGKRMQQFGGLVIWWCVRSLRCIVVVLCIFPVVT